MNMVKKERVEFYIDHHNVRKSAINAGVWIGCSEIVDRLTGDKKMMEKYVFDSYIPHGYDSLRRCHDRLRYEGFRMILREVDSEERKQKGVDMEMGLMMYRRAREDHYDTAVIVSGDGDFVPVVEYLHALGKRVEVAAFTESLSKELSRAADIVHELNLMVSPTLTSYIEPIVELEIEQKTAY